jgi:hypothetical protein
MFLGVGRANGVGVLDYQNSLIQGMFGDYVFLSVVFFVWTIYALKCSNFISVTLRRPEFSYLYMLSHLRSIKLYVMLLQVVSIIYLPVLTYAAVVLFVGFREEKFVSAYLVLGVNVTICVAMAVRAFYQFRKPGVEHFTINWKLPVYLQRNFYFSFLVKFVMANNKVLFFVVKLYSCGLLYLVLDEREPAEEIDLRLLMFFFAVGMLGHGVLIHRLKEMENTRTAFYRVLPVGLWRRFAEYAVFYFLIFIPELLTIALRIPNNLTYSEAFMFSFFGYGMLLLLNSLQLYNYTGMKDYFKTLMQVFIGFILAVIGNVVFSFSVIVFVSAVILFFTRYYRFEPVSNNATNP